MQKKTSKIFIFLSSILLMLLLVFEFSIRTKADTFQPNLLINVYLKNDNLERYHCLISGYINNGIITNSDINDTFYIAFEDTNITEIGVYVVSADYNIDTYTIETYTTMLLNDYLTLYYNNGYNIGLEENNEVVYNQGVYEGFTNGKNQGYEQGKNEGLQIGDQQGYERGYEAGINAQIPNQQFSILALLGTIFMFPYKLIALGFDVEIFGVNFGKLLIFTLWCLLIFGIIRLVKRGI